jgi:glycosyltransferase involved in cell wall biosynthesis
MASVVVLPSLAESFGYALVEAMCLGKPIIATACGGIAEVVGDSEAAVLVPMANAPALAEAIIAVLTRPELGQKLGEAGRLRANRFSVTQMVRGYEAIYPQGAQ